MTYLVTLGTLEVLEDVSHGPAVDGLYQTLLYLPQLVALPALHTRPHRPAKKHACAL